MTPKWLGAAIDFGLAGASVLGFPAGEAGKFAASGDKLYEKIGEKKRAASLNDAALIETTQASILDGWLTEARGDWLTEADAKAANDLLDRHLAACLPSFEEMAALAGETDRLAATVALALGKLEVRDEQFRSNNVIRRFAEEVLALVIREVGKRHEFRALLVTYDVEEIAQITARIEAKVDRLVAAIEPQPIAAQARRAGVKPRAFVQLARKVNGAVDDETQALAELEAAVAELAKSQSRAARGSTLDAMVDDALRSVAEKARQGDFDAAADEAARAFAEWQRREADRRARERADGERLIEANIEQHRFRRDPAAMAQWVERRLALEADAEEAPLDELYCECRRWQEAGEAKGRNLDLEVAISIARRAIQRSDIRSEVKGSFLNLQGVAFQALGELTVNVELLERSVATFSAALAEPAFNMDPSRSINARENRANSLCKIGLIKKDFRILMKSLNGYLIVLEQIRTTKLKGTCSAYSNMSTVYRSLGEITGGEIYFKKSLELNVEAANNWTASLGRSVLGGLYFNRGNLLSSMAASPDTSISFRAAVRAYRAAINCFDRESFPFRWALTQSALGQALYLLGTKEGDIKTLRCSLSALEACLTVQTRDNYREQWVETQFRIAVVKELLADRLPLERINYLRSALRHADNAQTGSEISRDSP
jgi:tetratricopeptide (TPR) repeat protein